MANGKNITAFSMLHGYFMEKSLINAILFYVPRRVKIICCAGIIFRYPDLCYCI